MSESPIELYRAPIDGLRCLRSAGRIRRLKLPLPADPPQDGPPAACFLCHPERDRLDFGPWPRSGGVLRVIGNANPFADRALLVAPPGEANHLATPTTLAVELLAQLLELPFDPGFAREFDLLASNVVAFLNVGRRAAQSRRHPHLQIVAFAASRGPLIESDAEAIRADLAAAAHEDRALALENGSIAVVPRQPSFTAEVWLPLPDRGAAPAAWVERAGALQALCAAGERALSGDYNLVVRASAPALIRLVPRGLSERAGLELAAPALLSGVVGTSLRESVLLWRGALGSGTIRH
ncbi:MAG: hypothetical protein EXS13_02790 [Planctomycetes bacterium]|nr:hypothetical protein [Planctomycetota bacterium]